MAIPFHWPSPHRYSSLYLAQPVMMPTKVLFPVFYSPAFLEAATPCSGKSPEDWDSTGGAKLLNQVNLYCHHRDFHFLTVNISPMKYDTQELKVFNGMYFGMKYSANLKELQALCSGSTTH